ncbi:MAG: helix-turn-helix domain-containing protein, partial [Spirochaetales bacterium]|nr:helix-turn-helix domain-containing protein [Spirochaetales bacterium]
GSSIYLLLNYRIEKAEDIRRKLRELNSEMIANSRLFESARISMSLGKAVEGPSYLIESRKSSDQAMGERLIREEGIRIFEEAPSAGRGSCDRILAEWNRKMESICDLLDPEAGKGAVDDLLNRLYGEECSGVMVLETLREAGHRFFLLLKDRGEENYNSLKSSFDRDLNLLAGYREFQEYLRNLIYSCFQEMKESREQADSQPVRDAKIFISTNYKDNSISLEKVAQSIDLSPSYFSSLFKQQTGEGFLDYLTSIRVEEAKELLRTSRMTVSAVASEVGYSDTKYFTRLFKKLTGIKPSEFRKIYG